MKKSTFHFTPENNVISDIELMLIICYLILLVIEWRKYIVSLFNSFICYESEGGTVMDKNPDFEKELHENEVAAANAAHSHPDPVSGEAESERESQVPKSTHPDPELNAEGEEIVKSNSDEDA